MLHHLRASAVLLGLFTLLLGIAYPLAVTGIGQARFASANGSLIITQRPSRRLGNDRAGFRAGRTISGVVRRRQAKDMTHVRRPDRIWVPRHKRWRIASRRTSRNMAAIREKIPV